TLTTLGLGSCVGVCLYDKVQKISGMAHVMLPSSSGYEGQNRAKFADSAIADLVKLMVSMGAGRNALTAKIAGGAHMFSGSMNNVLKVGQRNAETCIATLEELRIPIRANDTGGTHGRTIELYSDTGMLKIRTVGGGEKLI
ncbi:MAG: chemotaxis protein CheD, partial [Oscillospiraceae bacterium]|nr:chemotaxis protein CheD [Oscillospiraceae bacterium]